MNKALLLITTVVFVDVITWDSKQWLLLLLLVIVMVACYCCSPRPYLRCNGRRVS